MLKIISACLLLFVAALVALCATPAMTQRAATFSSAPAATAQASPPASSNKAAVSAPAASARGVIRGRVVDESGRGIAELDVRISRTGSQGAPMPVQRSDEDGEFTFTNLDSGIYYVSASLPGYYLSEPASARIGDDVTIKLTKGGVITGAVKTAAGVALPGVAVQVMSARDRQGRPLRGRFAVGERYTDDRGVYRIYGLPAGVYVVAAGGRNTPGLFGDAAQTFYPSSTRDAASEVVVSSGQESTDIDITLRESQAHAISGSIVGLPEAAEASSVSLELQHAVTGAQEAWQSANPWMSNGAFEFRGVEDGDYFVTARFFYTLPSRNGGISEPALVKVRGADVTGVKLTLTPLGSLAGRVTLERLRTANAQPACQAKRPSSLAETSIFFMRDKKDDPPDYRWIASGGGVVLDDGGEFHTPNQRAGRYRFRANLPDETWYVKSVTERLGGRGVRASDVATQGVLLRAGESRNNLNVTIAEGGASISGKVLAATEAEKLPTRLRVYAVPAERERADEVLRYAEAEVGVEATYRLAHLAPGKYWLLVKAISEEEEATRQWRAAYWEAAGRLALRKEAEAAATSSELAGCQQVKDLRLRYKTANSVSKPAVSKE